GRGPVTENAYKGMAAPRTHKGQGTSIRGPLHGPIRSARIKELLGLSGTVDGTGPDLSLPDKCHAVTLRGDHRFIPFAKQDRFASGKRHTPYLHLGGDRKRCRIAWRMSVPSAVVPALYEHHPTPIARKLHAGDLVSEILIICRQLAHPEVRAFGHVQVAPALLIDGHRDAATRGSGRQFRWKRIGCERFHIRLLPEKETACK